MLGSIEAREGQFNATLEPLVERIRKSAFCRSTFIDPLFLMEVFFAERLRTRI